MNLKFTFTFIFIITSFISFSQADKMVARPADPSQRWLPVNYFDAPQSTVNPDGSINAAPPLTNVIGKVSFYSQENSCGEEEVLFLKIINVNNYPVTVEWKASPSSPLASVNVPSMANVQGDCSEEDENLEKLVIVIDENMEQDPDYIYTHLEVKK